MDPRVPAADTRQTPRPAAFPTQAPKRIGPASNPEGGIGIW
jgi:hypothetical protein